ncbi:MAG TPA: pyrimidine dimer DNA glycosylase/endonuclease V [Chitinophagaceae bacterium]
MRIWSLHPSYLDTKGLVALWRETLLAKHVLLGKTKGYTRHPQLNRFYAAPQPVDAIDYYLSFILEEAKKRGYQFDSNKVNLLCKKTELTVTRGQLRYELDHLLAKLKARDAQKYSALAARKRFSCHPMFRVVPGPVADWEVVS